MGRLSRKTKQKQLLASVLDSFRTFFTADDIFTKARAKDASIGIATVYRFLSEHRKHGALCSFSCQGKTLYSTRHTRHCHFVCERCGAISHFVVRDIGFIKSKIKGSICHFQIEVKGICEDCQAMHAPRSQQSL